MGDLSIVINEKINLKILKDRPEYLLKYEDNYFLSDVGKSLFEVYKTIYFDKQMELTNQNILLFGNERNNNINDLIVSKLDEAVYDINKFSEYYLKLKQDYVKNYIDEKVIRDIIIEAQSKNTLDVNNINQIIKKLQSSLTILDNKENLFLTPEQMLNNYESELRDRMEGKSYSIGCSHLDRMLILGARPGLITTIFAATGLAKSSFALYLDNKRINKGIPSLHLALENDNFLSTERLLSMRWQYNIRNYYNPEESMQEELSFLLQKERNNLKKTNRYLFVEEAGLKINDVEVLIAEAKKTMGVDYLICTIDLASMLTDFGTSPDEIENAMNRLHYIARRQNAHLILVIQANRKTDDLKIKKIDDIENLKPSLGGIKNSGAIAERSRVVLGLFRRMHYIRQYFPEDPRIEVEDDVLECMILKQNSGPPGILKYLYFPESSYFVPFKHNANKEIPNA